MSTTTATKEPFIQDQDPSEEGPPKKIKGFLSEEEFCAYTPWYCFFLVLSIAAMTLHLTSAIFSARHMFNQKPFEEGGEDTKIFKNSFGMNIAGVCVTSVSLFGAFCFFTTIWRHAESNSRTAMLKNVIRFYGYRNHMLIHMVGYIMTLILLSISLMVMNNIHADHKSMVVAPDSSLGFGTEWSVTLRNGTDTICGPSCILTDNAIDNGECSLVNAMMWVAASMLSVIGNSFAFAKYFIAMITWLKCDSNPCTCCNTDDDKATSMELKQFIQNDSDGRINLETFIELLNNLDKEVKSLKEAQKNQLPALTKASGVSQTKPK